MEEHPIQKLMATTMENLNEMIDVNTIIGDPVETSDGTLIIPISKLGFGFAAGGSEFSQQDQESQDNNLPFGGGAGGGVSVTPIAFLIVHSKGVKMIHMNEHVHLYEKLLDLAPQAIDKVEQIFSESPRRTDDSTEETEKSDRKKRRSRRRDDTSDHNFMI